MTRSDQRRPFRALVRGAWLAAILAVAAAGLGWIPLPSPRAAGQDAPPPAAADPKQDAKPDAKKEEHGGDLVFHVISKIQKFSVLYSHERHLKAGIECEECHEKIFQKKINTNHFKMADVNRGTYCGVCHTLTPDSDVKHPAFAPKNNCTRCHTLRVREPDNPK